MTTDQGDDCPPMAVEPLSDVCAAVVEQGEHACFGISPFNSYRSAAGQGFAVVTPAGRG
ncbi:hypothetical protein SSP24_41680 [Streptomyces spinoverrucosus]|uniref:Cyclodipeptide synthase n=1 Tax=Streptomyces spinoverrucosus TaxID=284043 RepID=A0A4Y3VIZ4_9ACTN|nr:tRNA-dependent cyclodipeptide synthase [Streptomyces spinoverrucosus]GEC06513.1 hypothetical protein SSP24_41680 [Streptomyces spinoverrucosus]GHB54639.1 hypothetical protein GCM10010397_26170 [Streptomyces spinoverrucosus]